MAILSGCSARAPVPDGVRQEVLEALAPAGGEWAVYFKHLETGAELEVRADDEFHPASTLKVWVLIKVFQDVREGRYRLEDELEVTKRFPSAARRDPRPFDVEPASRKVASAVGGRMPIRHLAEEMITVSDNVATNVLIGRAGGPDAITSSLAAHGVRRSNVRRFIMDSQAFEEGFSSVACARDFGRIFERLARGEVVSPEASSAMLGIMGRLRDNSMLPRRLPSEARVAHKTGAIDGVRADAGLVTLPDGRRYVAAFFGRGFQDEKKAEACIAGASRVLYDFASR